MVASLGLVDVMSERALNRTTLRRQLLLQRSALPAVAAVEHLVAVQGQEPDAPYVGLWSRLDGFAVPDLAVLLQERRVVRGSVLRATQHLVTAEDYVWLRPLLAPVLRRAWRSLAGAKEIDVDAIAADAAAELAGRTMTRPQVRERLRERWPGVETLTLNWAVQALVPILHPPPAGLWGHRGVVPMALAEDWLGRELAAPDPAALITRYLTAYGPATVRDVQAFSGLTRLREVADRLPLRTWRTPDGATLLDVPDAPVADGDEPAPVRFLPEFDNVVLGYADRRRMMADEHRPIVCDGGATWPTVLVDGRVAAMWRFAGACLEVTPLVRLGAADRAEVVVEGERLLAFARPGAADAKVRVLASRWAGA